MSERKVTALAPWFGSNRILAENVGKALAGSTWAGIPFAGGMCELWHIKAPTIVVSDVHRHIINLSSIATNGELCPALVERLGEFLVHPDTLEWAQNLCRLAEKSDRKKTWMPDPVWASAYMVCCWMSRNGTAGTANEFDSTYSVRWKDGVGDSATRFRNATAALADFPKVAANCTFVVEDCFEFLSRCHDLPKHSIYADPPWPDDGDQYANPFTIDDQRDLAGRLAKFTKTRVVVRYGDHPLIRELYPASRWNWQEFESRTGANKAKAEVLITNGK